MDYDFSIDDGCFQPSVTELNTPDRTETIWLANPNMLPTRPLQWLALDLGMNGTTSIHLESLTELNNVLSTVPGPQLTQIHTGCDYGG